MRHVVDNLTRQHRELVRTATRLFAWLDPSRLKSGAADAHRAAAQLTGTLRVHLAMEDRQFYPSLVAHKDPKLAELARKFLDERCDLERRFEAWREAWSSAAAIAAAPERFVDDTRVMLGAMWQRMNDEDQLFHPKVLEAWRDDQIPSSD